MSFLDLFTFDGKFTVLDFFAGAGRLARGGRALGPGFPTFMFTKELEKFSQHGLDILVDSGDPASR